MTNYQYVIIGGGMTAAAAVDGIRTSAAILREIKEHLGLSTRTCKGQAVIDRDDDAVIGVPTKVRPARDERKQRRGYEKNTDDCKGVGNIDYYRQQWADRQLVH